MKKAIFIALILILAGFLIYRQLGGFNPIEVNEVSRDGYVIAGKIFEGRYNDGNIRKLFFRVRDWSQSDSVSGDFVIVNFKDPSLDEKVIRNLVGVLVSDSAGHQLPAGFSYHHLEASRALQALINAHNLVMPRPGKVEKILQKEANSKGLALDSLSVEIYKSERELVIEIPVRD